MSEKTRSMVSTWKRGLIAATTLAMAVGGLAVSPLLSVNAHADDNGPAGPTQGQLATGTSSNGTSVVSSNSIGTTKTVPFVDMDAIYGIDGNGQAVGNIAVIDTTSGDRTQQFATKAPTLKTEQITVAVDGGGYDGRTKGFYTWYRGGNTTDAGAPAGTFPLWFYPEGATSSTTYFVPDAGSFESAMSGGTFGGGGAVNQVTGQLYIKPGNNQYMATSLRLLIFDPKTLDTYWSGQLKPATEADHLWTNTVADTSKPGYVAPGMAITASGDFWLLVQGTDKQIEANDPMNTTGATIAAGSTSVSFLIKVHPTFTAEPWQYSVVKMITKDPNDTSGQSINGTQGQGGLTFLDGMLYLVAGTNLFSIDPSTGYWKWVAPLKGGETTANPAPQDPANAFFALASAQTATSITGTVYQGSAAGVFNASDPVAVGQTIALYKQVDDGSPVLEGTTTTNSVGEYSFLTSGSKSDGSIKYYVQVVQPKLNGNNAQVTAGLVLASPQNVAELVCGNGTLTSNNSIAVSGACTSTATTPPLGSTINLKTDGAYGAVTLRDAWSDPRVDFTINEPAPPAPPAPPQPDANRSTLTVSPTTQSVGQSVTATATIRDEDGNLLPDITVKLGSNNSSTRSADSCVTTAAGTCSITITDDVDETVSVTAKVMIDDVSTDISDSPAPVRFKDYSPKAGPFTCGELEGTGIYPSAQTKTVDETATVYALITDQYCTPVPGVDVTLAFTSPNGTATVTSPGATVTGLTVTGTTDANGKVTVNINDTKSETVSASGSFPTAQNIGTATATFGVGAPVAGPYSCPDPNNPGKTIAGTGVYALPSSVHLSETSLITALVTDQYCQPVPGVDVTLTTTTPGQLSDLSGTSTGTDGTVTATLSSTAAGTATVTGTFGPSDTAMGSVHVHFSEILVPTITSPGDGDLVDSGEITVTGTGDPGTTITVTVDDGDGCTAEVHENGEWSCTITGLEDGEHTVTATADDGDGHESDPSDEITFTVDTTAPEAPVITSPKPDELLNSGSVTVEGTAEAYSTVTATIGDKTCTVDADKDGVWSCQIDGLTDGDYTVTATATDKAGNESDPCDPVPFTVDSTAPEAPVITSPKPDALLNSGNVTVEGTAEAYSTVTATIGDKTCTVDADKDGVWSCQIDGLTDGDYTVTATATDKAGNESDPSDEVKFTVDSTAPEAPVITSPKPDELLNSGSVTVEGTAEPDSYVTATTDDGKTCTAQADEHGDWSCTITDVKDGEHSVTATATDEAGNESGRSDAVYFTVDTKAPDAPVITSPADGDTVTSSTVEVRGSAEVGSTVTVTTDDGHSCTATTGENGEWYCTLTGLSEGERSVTATATDAAGNESDPSDEVKFTVDTSEPPALVPPAVPEITSPGDGDLVDSGEVTVTGTGDPGTTITVTIDGGDGCTATTDEHGDWSCTITDVKDGEHSVTATATDGDGHESGPSDEIKFTVDTTAPDAPVIESPADGDTVTSSTVTVTGSAEVGSTVTVTTDDGHSCTATTGENGEWYCTLTGLSEGERSVTATATDAAGNESDPSDEVKFTVDTSEPPALVPPAVPEITSPGDGDLVDSGEVTVTGTGDPGTNVTVTVDDGDKSCTAEVGENGEWSCTITGLEDGEHTVTATATDGDGHESGPSDEIKFTVDTSEPPALVPPAVPEITSPGDGDLVDSGEVTVTGTGDPGTNVTVTVDDGDKSCTAEVGENGEWSCTITGLEDGEHTVTATADDGEGHESGPSDEIKFTVDATAPEAPVILTPTQGGHSKDRPVHVTGTAEPGSEVTVTAENGKSCTATADQAGAWACDLDLGDGQHTLTATAKDKAGNQSEPTIVTFTVDAQVASGAKAHTGGSLVSSTPMSIAGAALAMLFGCLVLIWRRRQATSQVD